MTVDQIKKYIPDSWLQNHWDEFIAMAVKVTRTLIISTAVEKKWTKPMKSQEDFVVFFEDEAKLKEITPSEVEYYFFEAGRLKARNFIFEKHCIPLLPKNDKDECKFRLDVLLAYINSTVPHKELLKI